MTPFVDPQSVTFSPMTPPRYSSPRSPRSHMNRSGSPNEGMSECCSSPDLLKGECDSIGKGDPTSLLWRDCVFPVLWRYAKLFRSSVTMLRGMSLNFLQRSLLHPRMLHLTSEDWWKCFEVIIFPSLDSVTLATESEKSLYVNWSSVVAKVFCASAGTLRAHSRFWNLWLLILDHFTKSGNFAISNESVAGSFRSILSLVVKQMFLRKPSFLSESCDTSEGIGDREDGTQEVKPKGQRYFEEQLHRTVTEVEIWNVTLSVIRTFFPDLVNTEEFRFCENPLEQERVTLSSLSPSSSPSLSPPLSDPLSSLPPSSSSSPSHTPSPSLSTTSSPLSPNISPISSDSPSPSPSPFSFSSSLSLFSLLFFSLSFVIPIQSFTKRNYSKSGKNWFIFCDSTKWA